MCGNSWQQRRRRKTALQRSRTCPAGQSRKKGEQMSTTDRFGKAQLVRLLCRTPSTEFVYIFRLYRFQYASPFVCILIGMLSFFYQFLNLSNINVLFVLIRKYPFQFPRISL